MLKYLSVFLIRVFFIMNTLIIISLIEEDKLHRYIKFLNNIIIGLFDLRRLRNR